ncbi:hypothetical protein KFK09_022368 [Dendrobium nobile]|uniref:Uncharacterized protein n=1 Tax=Dendrobium nobile TaxID=94219 RepID=A0A8T3AJ66_DENNO|nr:hypothetical protein KFK09_022368 [Dendrobium nobile]
MHLVPAPCTSSPRPTPPARARALHSRGLSPTTSCTYPPVQRALRLHLRSARHKPTLRTVASGQRPACLSRVPCASMRSPRAPNDLAPPSTVHSRHSSQEHADSTSMSPGLHRKSKTPPPKKI